MVKDILSLLAICAFVAAVSLGGTVVEAIILAGRFGQ